MCVRCPAKRTVNAFATRLSTYIPLNLRTVASGASTGETGTRASVMALGDDCAARPINPALNATRAVIRRSEKVSSRFQRASFHFASDMRLLSTFAMMAVGAFDGDDVARH